MTINAPMTEDLVARVEKLENMIRDVMTALEYIEKTLHDMPDQSLRGTVGYITTVRWNIENIRLRLEEVIKHN